MGVLGTLSPEMARDLGEAFSLDQIGARQDEQREARSSAAGRGALRLASRAAAFLAVTAVAVSLTLTALYLMQF